jgi:HD-GYP domain-containing protein (c-di-GMP phosphodiesterase class II)
MSLKKIPSDRVEIGMYISSLDRPWLETPFMFQGFMVRTQEEIEELRRHARYVYIAVPDEEIELSNRTVDQPELPARAVVFHQVSYADSTTVEEEINSARASHEVFSELFTEVGSLVSAGHPVPMVLFEQPVKKLVSSVTSNPDAYLWLTRLKHYDSFLYKDSIASAVWATALGRKIGIAEQELQNLAVGCMLMDIGKLSLPNEVLHKAERLDHDEWELMKTHVELGVKLLENSPGYRPDVLNIVRTHHERLNGCGYPSGLQGSQIPLFGQMAGIVDQYVSVTNPRPFGKTVSPSKAEDMLYKQRGHLFDEILVEYFIQTLSTYPTGSLVELSSGEVGIVKGQRSGKNLKPDVILLLDPDKQSYGSYPLVNLDDYSKNNLPVRIVKTLADGEYGISVEELLF